MDSVDTYWTDRALLEWQVELGAVDAIADTPVDRYALVEEAAKPRATPATPVTDQRTTPRKPAPPAPPAPPAEALVDAVKVARETAASAVDLETLKHAVTQFSHCDLRQGARKAVFATGSPAARVMIVAEAPNRAEDRAGAPFVGDEGALLDQMLAAIGLSRTSDDPARAAYLLAPLPWRTPGDNLPELTHMEMMLPFLERHITLVDPTVIVIMGNTGLQMLTGQGGLTNRRGKWLHIMNRPAIATFHPAHLLRTPIAKRAAWADLLALKAKIAGGSH